MRPPFLCNPPRELFVTNDYEAALVTDHNALSQRACKRVRHLLLKGPNFGKLS